MAAVGAQSRRGCARVRRPARLGFTSGDEGRVRDWAARRVFVRPRRPSWNSRWLKRGKVIKSCASSGALRARRMGSNSVRLRTGAATRGWLIMQRPRWAAWHRHTNRRHRAGTKQRRVARTPPVHEAGYRGELDRAAAKRGASDQPLCAVNCRAAGKLMAAVRRLAGGGRTAWWWGRVPEG